MKPNEMNGKKVALWPLLLGVIVVMGACKPHGTAAVQDFTRTVYEPAQAVGFEIVGIRGARVQS